MIRRTVAFALWAYFGWYAAAYVMTQLGMPTTLAPLGAAVMIVIAAIDWPAAQIDFCATFPMSCASFGAGLANPRRPLAHARAAPARLSVK